MFFRFVTATLLLGTKMSKQLAPPTSVDPLHMADLEQEHFRKMSLYRNKMDAEPVFSALKSFNAEEAVNMSGVYEIYNQGKAIYIGGNPYFSNIRDCLNAHFSGNDGLTIGAFLSGPGKNQWMNMTVRWMSCDNPHEVAFYLLEEYRGRYGILPEYNNPPANPIPQPHDMGYSDSDSDE